MFKIVTVFGSNYSVWRYLLIANQITKIHLENDHNSAAFVETLEGNLKLNIKSSLICKKEDFGEQH